MTKIFFFNIQINGASIEGVATKKLPVKIKTIRNNGSELGGKIQVTDNARSLPSCPYIR